MIDIVPAPGRQFKTYSMILAIAIGSFDALLLMLKTFGDIHLLSNDHLLAINAVLAFAIVPLKLVQQFVPLTTAQKLDVIETASAQPVKDGHRDVVTMVEVAPASSVVQTPAASTTKGDTDGHLT